MSKVSNPFFLSGYHGPDYFCDRETEIERLRNNVLNGVNSTLISIRRMGKTGLILHLGNDIEKNYKIPFVYLDIYAEQSLAGFANSLATACLRKFPEKTTVGKVLWSLLKSMRPVFTFDVYTGQPQVSIDFKQPQEIQHSIQDIFQLLDKQGNTILIAIDEFQQINLFNDKNTEAILRTAIQPLKNVRFIFSGSQHHMLTEMFHNSKRPFFSATQSLFLGPVNKDSYESFIVRHFNNGKRNISKEAVEYILSFSKNHTYYTQLMCNRLFANGWNNITVNEVGVCAHELMREQAPTYLQLRTLLTANQWNLLVAIAKEGNLYHPTANQFIKKYSLGAGSAVQRALSALTEKELLYQLQDEKGSFYAVYDTLMSRWMETL